MQLLWLVLTASSIGLFFAIVRIVKHRKTSRAIKEHFFHNFPDALMEVAKNQVRDGQNRLEPTLGIETVIPKPLLQEEPISSEEKDLPEDSACAEEQPQVVPVTPELPLRKSSESDHFIEDLPLQKLPPVDKELLDSTVDFIIEITFPQPYSLPLLPCFTTTRRYTIVGFDCIKNAWQLAHAEPHIQYAALKIGLQMVDRNGAISHQELHKFCEEVTGFVEHIKGSLAIPDIEEKLAAAENLDRFCAEVDVLVNIHLSFKHPVDGKMLFETLKNSGLSLESDGIFHAFSDDGENLFTLSDEKNIFDKNNLPAFSTELLTLFFDVPRTKKGIDSFDKGIDLLKKLAQRFEGNLVDDNHLPLTDVGLAKIRQQLLDIYACMRNKAIEPGSPLSHRLFI